MKPEITPFLKSEKAKPKDGKAFIGGFMVSWKWEDVTSKLSKLFTRKSKANNTENVRQRK